MSEVLVFIDMKEMEEEMEEVEIELYESDASDKYEMVSTNKLFKLVQSNKVTYEVYKRRWYIITIILFIILVSMI